MMASLYSGVSGLKNHQVKLNVIGNNIANINTIGFQASRVNFQEALVQTTRAAGRPSSLTGGTNPIQLGLGMEVGAIDTLFKQGGMETTGQITDLAIQGKGFFILGDANGNKFYTRAGAFGFDADGTLVDPATGLYVFGKMATSTGEISPFTTTDKIVLPFGQQDPANATQNVWISNNLDASATDSEASLTNAGDSSILLTSGETIDGVGGTHSIAISGAQATRDSFTSSMSGLVGTMTLGTLVPPVTDLASFTISVDGSPAGTISGLSTETTIDSLLSKINQIAGLTASLNGAGEIELVRDRAGATAEYNFGTSNAVANDVLNIVFGIAGGSSLNSSGGTAATLVAVDTFMPTKGAGSAAGPVITNLGLVFNENTGIVTGLSGLGGGGVEITSGSAGITETTTSGNHLIIDTESTIHTASISVFDSQGGKHTVSIEFFKSIQTNRWEWTATALGNESMNSGSTGYVAFNPDGSLNTFEYNGGADSVSIDPNNGAETMQITIDAGTSFGYDGLTGFASGQHTASLIKQDGYGVGILDKISIDKGGNIAGIFTNGVTRVLAQLVIGDFFNQNGLLKAGKSMYQESSNSGSAVEGIAGETISADIFSGALESSSVDIAQEFTSMITAQRGFQANARVITTSDSMLDDLVNIKR